MEQGMEQGMEWESAVSGGWAEAVEEDEAAKRGGRGACLEDGGDGEDGDGQPEDGFKRDEEPAATDDHLE